MFKNFFHTQKKIRKTGKMPYNIVVGRDEADKKRFGDRGLVYIGKQYVKMGQLTSLSNLMLLDIARSHVIMIAGKRGSGKSYSLAVIAEELSLLPEETAKNIAPLIFDTMGIFWTMRYANEKEHELLREWKLEPKNTGKDFCSFWLLCPI